MRPATGCFFDLLQRGAPYSSDVIEFVNISTPKAKGIRVFNQSDMRLCMAFSVTVYLLEHLPLINRVPANSDEIDQWMEQCAKLRLYDAPLGSGSIIYDYWSTIGYYLKLPLITSIYKDGLELDHTRVAQLETEVEQLEKYWKEHSLEGVEKYKTTEAEIKKDLFERIDYLKEAIRITKERKAVLIIS